MKTIGLFFGGASVEHDVSIISAQVIARGFTKLSDQYRLIPVYITNHGHWHVFTRFPTLKELKQQINSRGNITILPDPKTNQLILHRRGSFSNLKIDIALPLIHGTSGEDGTLQGLLELMNVPYTGSGVLGAAIGMDKIIMKDILATHNLPQTDYLWFSRDDWHAHRETIFTKISARFQFPIFIKPANLGSSIGITKATNRDSLEQAIEVAAHYSPRILAEQGIAPVREINCAVLGYKDIIPSVLEEPLPYSEFLTFSDKYIGGQKGGSMKGAKDKVKIPAPVSDIIKNKVQELAITTSKVLDCYGSSRVDFLLNESNEVFINEINTIPGSLQQHLWQASGVTLPELIQRIISIAEAVHADKQANFTTYNSTLLK